jgi:hypothetical protein
MRGVTVNTVSASAFDCRNKLVLLHIEMPLDVAAELGIPPPGAKSVADTPRAHCFYDITLTEIEISK